MCHHRSLHGVGRLLCLSFLFLLVLAGAPAAGKTTTDTDTESTGSLAKACDPNKLQRSAKSLCMVQSTLVIICFVTYTDMLRQTVFGIIVPFRCHRRLYVTTVDGTLTALDVNGQTLWHYDKGEPLFSSSLSQAKVSVRERAEQSD